MVLGSSGWAAFTDLQSTKFNSWSMNDITSNSIFQIDRISFQSCPLLSVYDVNPRVELQVISLELDTEKTSGEQILFSLKRASSEYETRSVR